jgi:hypothetical protein
VFVTTDVPGHHRPTHYQAIKVPIAALRQRGFAGRIGVSFRPQVAFEVRQRRAGGVFGEVPVRPAEAELRLIMQQFAEEHFVPIKAAALAGNIQQENGGASATSAGLRR